MNYKTKKALILLMIVQFFTIATSILMSLYLSSTSIQSIISGINQSIHSLVITSGLLSSIGGMLLLLGAFLFFLGRKEYGYKHQKFVSYAGIIFIIALFVIIFNFTVSLTSPFLSSMESSEVSNDPSYIADMLTKTLSTTATIFAPLITILTGLIWIFALYQLENKKGKIILFLAFIAMILFSAVTGLLSLTHLNNFIDSESFTISVLSTYELCGYLDYLSVYEWIGSLGIINGMGNVLVSLLLFIALYLAYKRIGSGSLCSDD